ncbi:3107_t:CDS:1 [Cetraspora pellucida]|uniref:3107_t:CDS:1 n=1 Tax=Cetraspora pellucida TaxID=1433469 RepID=A0A9N8VSS6_9GLOM|nr:3107_t:CDS:1 [Cetraspora pellucida]
MIFTLRISRERVKTGIDLTYLPSPKSPKSYLEKYEKKLAELEQHELPAPQVITIPEIVQISAELEQDVPQQTQLLLQSGLPDQGIPLQIVLPQSNFHITSEEFENKNDKNEHQEESQTSHEVAPQVISITLSKDGEDSTNYTDSTDSNFLIIPSQPKSETSSLHEVPL